MTQQQLRNAIVKMAIAFLFLFLVLATEMFVGLAQNAPTVNNYVPSELQALRLKVKQQEAVLAQRDLRDAQLRLQTAMTELEALAQGIKKENKWADSVQFDVNTLTFFMPPPPPTPLEKDDKKP